MFFSPPRSAAALLPWFESAESRLSASRLALAKPAATPVRSRNRRRSIFGGFIDSPNRPRASEHPTGSVGSAQVPSAEPCPIHPPAAGSRRALAEDRGRYPC